MKSFRRKVIIKFGFNHKMKNRKLNLILNINLIIRNKITFNLWVKHSLNQHLYYT